MDYKKVIALVKGSREIVKNPDAKKDVRMKGDADFVTAVDTGISEYLREELHKLYPDIGFFSEEENGQLSDPCWILDPIDGTTNLVYGYEMSSISLGLYQDGKIVFGVVYNPFSRRTYVARLGKGAFLNDKQIHVSDRPLSESIIEFGAGSTRKEEAATSFAIAKDIFMKCVDIRRICSSALDLCFIADGRIDGYFEKKLKPWDLAAGSLILQEAGGKITDYDGNPIDFSKPTSCIASNGIIHDSILETIKKHN